MAAGHEDAQEERKVVRAEIKRRKETMSEARSCLFAFGAAFRREVEQIGIPGVQEPRVDFTDYLPYLGNTRFHELQASGGGISTAVHVATAWPCSPPLSTIPTSPCHRC